MGSAALQVGLYLWNRRHNVSPHEPAGSGGLAGMAMSAICGPVYLKSLGSALLRTKGRFVVTPKGGDSSPDRPATFRTHLFWAAVLAASLAASVRFGHAHAAMRVWAVLALAVALAPLAVWGATAVRGHRGDSAPGGEPGRGEEPAFATTGGN